LATLDVLEKEKLVAKAAKLGEAFLVGLNALRENYEMVRDVRGKGLMVGIEFGPPNSLKLKAGWTAVEKAQKGLFSQMIVMSLMRKHRLLTQVSGHRVNIIKFLPPLAIGEEEIDTAVNAMDQVLAEAHTFPGGMWKMGADLVKGALGR
jgi:ornithine--oxo-acid transaminase